MPEDSWRTLAETDQASEEFPRLAIKILDAQRRITLDVLQFTGDDVTRIIELIDRKVRDPSHPTRLRSSTFCRSYNMRIFRTA